MGQQGSSLWAVGGCRPRGRVSPCGVKQKGTEGSVCPPGLRERGRRRGVTRFGVPGGAGPGGRRAVGPQREAGGADALRGTRGEKDGTGGYGPPTFPSSAFPPPLPPGAGAPPATPPGVGASRTVESHRGEPRRGLHGGAEGRAPPPPLSRARGAEEDKSPQVPLSPRRSPSLPVPPRGGRCRGPPRRVATAPPGGRSRRRAAGRAARGRGYGGRARHPHARLSRGGPVEPRPRT